MKNNTQQMAVWSGDFGRQYTDRNPHTVPEMDVLYQNQFGVTRTLMNQEFLGELDREIRILEVGANVGVQLQALQQMGFKHLYGVELQAYAVEEAKRLTQNINLIQGSAFELPFRDGWFDLVFTSGVLIHINPKDVGPVLAEAHRCTHNYVWGFEYFADQCTEVQYRGESGLLWKMNYAQLYLDSFADLRLVREKRFKYLESANVNQMFLLQKTARA